MTHLREIFVSLDRSCDKFEHYFPLYERHLSQFVGKAPKILEIGVQYGGSAEMWRKYFGEGTVIHGVDINPLCEQTDYLQLHRGDQGSAAFWDGLGFPAGTFDIIMDDGSHDNPHQILTLKKTYSLLRDGGIYWCEDTHTSYYYNVRVRDGGYLNKNSFMEYSKNVIDVLNAHHTLYAIGVGPTPNGPHVDSSLLSLFHDIRGMHFYDSIVVLEKGTRLHFQRVILNKSRTT
jgi:hypothetical protein